MGRPNKGRQRIEIRLIKDADRLEVTLSKRKSGLLKKASELSLLCGTHVAFIVFSPDGRAFALGTSSVDHVLRRFDPLPGDKDEADLLALVQDGDNVSAVADRGAMGAIVRRTEQTKALVVVEGGLSWGRRISGVASGREAAPAVSRGEERWWGERKKREGCGPR